jgi:5-methyltetrahydrofolate--homocysteine methyltransferase
MNILEKIKKNKILLSDGALGTMLQEAGIDPGECPELWNITHRHEVLSIAKSYFQSGSDILTTNSFGGTIFKLSRYGLEERVIELNEAAAEIAREAAGINRYVAGSMGPSGKMLIMGDITENELYDGYCQQAQSLEKGGSDIIIIETMSAVDEAALAVRAARENTGCTVIITMTFTGNGHGEYRTMMGVSPEEMVSSMKDAGAHVVGSNCGNGIEQMIEIVKVIRAADNNIPVMVQPNAGIPEYIDGKTFFRESPEMMASFVQELIKAGANIIGGCCGTTPAHIREMGKAMVMG